MELNWNPVQPVDALFTKDRIAALALENEKRRAAEAANAQVMHDILVQAAQAPYTAFGKTVDTAVLEATHEQVSARLAKLVADPSPAPLAHTDPLFQGIPMVATPNSCVSGTGPMNSWGGSTGGGAGERTVLLDPANPRALGVRMFYGSAGSGHAWAGAGCWFRARGAGVARLRLSFVTSGRSVVAVTGPPFGYAHTHVRFFGSAWGAAESGWVDRGGAGEDLFVGTYYAAQIFENQSTMVTVAFDTVAGGYYYLAGGLQVWSGAGGFAFGGSTVRSLLTSIQMCEP